MPDPGRGPLYRIDSFARVHHSRIRQNRAESKFFVQDPCDFVFLHAFTIHASDKIAQKASLLFKIPANFLRFCIFLCKIPAILYFVAVPLGAPKRLVLAEADHWTDNAEVCEIGFTDDLGDEKLKRRKKTTHEKAGSLSGAGHLAEGL